MVSRAVEATVGCGETATSAARSHTQGSPLLLQRWHGFSSLHRRWFAAQAWQARVTRPDTATDALPLDTEPAVEPATEPCFLADASWPATWRLSRSLRKGTGWSERDGDASFRLLVRGGAQLTRGQTPWCRWGTCTAATACLHPRQSHHRPQATPDTEGLRERT